MFAAIAGYDFVTSHAHHAQILLAEFVINALKEQGEPVRLLGATIPDDLKPVDEATKQALRARLKQHSAIPD